MYAHGHTSAAQIAPESILNSAPAAPYQDRGENLNEMGGYGGYDSSHDDADSDDSEFGINDREYPNLGASSESGSEGSVPYDDQSQNDDEEFLEFNDMYS